MSLETEQARIGLHRWFTIEGVHPEDELVWERRSVEITNFTDGSVVFAQDGVEFPTTWSDTASKIVTQKYFRGNLGSPDREWSLRQIVDRVVSTIATWGEQGGYFADTEEATTFRAELSWLLLNQRAAFNSPVWFNIGVEGVPQQSSACFILSVDDSMESILNWYVEEGRIFKGGSGAGVNLSRLRSSKELLKGGGTPSGPVSFMRGADASAGTIKSGGKTRRAAKMVVLDVDHPDIDEFIWCKAREEEKARALQAAGFDVSLNGKDSHSLQYQNANNSVRLSDEFMSAVVEDKDWELRARTDGSIIETRKAKDLFSDIAEAAWQCADPGVQFSSTINRWHTSPSAGSINASNPCSEYLHLDNSACNLSSLNLLSFLGDDDQFDIEGFRSAVQIMTTAQEILVSYSSYPTDKIAQNTRKFRQLGLGYANLGALLMALGMPYDSDKGRSLAAALTAVMCGEAYTTSAKIAARLGPYAGFDADREAMLNVITMHSAATSEIDRTHLASDISAAIDDSWNVAVETSNEYGVRNAQTTVLAPTGTISFMMDCDTTGIEPDFALVKHKQLVGGGFLAIVNQTVARALKGLGYTQARIDDIVKHLEGGGTVTEAPGLRTEHHSIFACSVGENAITPTGHISMMAAVQPFLSGGISKTVNLPETATRQDIEELLIQAWQTGVKAVAVYRDNCKLGQPLSTAAKDDTDADADGTGAGSGGVEGGALSGSDLRGEIEKRAKELAQTYLQGSGPLPPTRAKLPRTRTSRTFEFRVADCKGFVTVGEYADGRPGEIFVRVSKQGSTLAGIMDAFAISLSHGLQYGVPLQAFVAAFVGMRFEPAGMTDDPDLRLASSLIDYLFRRLAVDYLSVEERSALNILTSGERTQQTLPGVFEATTQSRTGLDLTPQTGKGTNTSNNDTANVDGEPAGNSETATTADTATASGSATGAGAAGAVNAAVETESSQTDTSEQNTDSDPRRVVPMTVSLSDSGAPLCMDCGTQMIRSGSCYACQSCGATSGCS